MNVLEHALQMEQDATLYYEKLAREAPTQEIRTIFTLLAEAERSHHRVLSARKGEMEVALADSSLLEQSRNIFQRLLAMQELHGSFQVDSDGYRHAVKAEEESIKYYQKVADQEQNEEAKKLLLAIIAEEKIHLNIIENIYEFVEAPRTYLEWREFSNLKPL